MCVAQAQLGRVLDHTLSTCPELSPARRSELAGRHREHLRSTLLDDDALARESVLQRYRREAACLASAVALERGRQGEMLTQHLQIRTIERAETRRAQAMAQAAARRAGIGRAGGRGSGERGDGGVGQGADCGEGGRVVRAPSSGGMRTHDVLEEVSRRLRGFSLETETDGVDGGDGGEGAGSVEIKMTGACWEGIEGAASLGGAAGVEVDGRGRDTGQETLERGRGAADPQTPTSTLSPNT